MMTEWEERNKGKRRYMKLYGGQRPFSDSQRAIVRSILGGLLLERVELKHLHGIQ